MHCGRAPGCLAAFEHTSEDGCSLKLAWHRNRHFLSLWTCEGGWNSAQHSCSVKPEESGSVIWAQQLLHAFIPTKTPGIAPVGLKPAVLAASVACSVHSCLYQLISVCLYPQDTFQTQRHQTSSVWFYDFYSFSQVNEKLANAPCWNVHFLFTSMRKHTTSIRHKLDLWNPNILSVFFNVLFGESVVPRDKRFRGNVSEAQHWTPALINKTTNEHCGTFQRCRKHLFQMFSVKRVKF